MYNNKYKQICNCGSCDFYTFFCIVQYCLKFFITSICHFYKNIKSLSKKSENTLYHNECPEATLPLHILYGLAIVTLKSGSFFFFLNKH